MVNSMGDNGFDNFDSFSWVDDEQGPSTNLNNGESTTFEDGFSENFDDVSGNSDNQKYSNNDFNENRVDDANKLGKKSFIMIVVGACALILVLIVASVITKSAKKRNQETRVYNEAATQNDVNSQPSKKVDATDLMNSKTQQQSDTTEQDSTQQDNVVINNVKEGGTVWTEITAEDKDNVKFKEGLTDMMFTVTGISHKARAVDASETLVIKTTLTGSIAGLPGTYEIDVPFDKGVKLQELGIGTQFTVHVQLGEFKGRTVVGNITY